MPRPRPPPTPASSTDIAARERQISQLDMENTFVLPPAAVSPTQIKGHTKASAVSNYGEMQQSSPPLSPLETSTSSKLQRKRTLSGGNKPKIPASAMSPSTQPPPTHDLPPPPSRARKIIQMKPKQSPNLKAQDQPASVSSNASKTSSSQSSTTATKRAKAQPTATTAAGRKIARKTAHSIIERRRRSKMNEEFGVLKDMIPACTGVEMHKLAILQAGIEYLRYLEGCIEKLKDRNEQLESSLGQSAMEDQDDDMEVDAETEPEDSSIGRPGSTAVAEDGIASEHRPQLHKQHQPYYSQRSQTSSSQVTSTTSSAYTSPNLRPMTSSASVYHHSNRQNQPQSGYSILPPLSTHSSVPNSPLSFQPPSSAMVSKGQASINNTPTATPFGMLATGISPAIHAFQFSPDMNRASMYASSTPGTSISTSSVTGHTTADGTYSPHIAPLPQAALPLPTSSFRAINGTVIDKPGAAEANATAALLMMGSDRRASIGAIASKSPSENGNNSGKTTSGKGMSVKDLLSS